VYKEATQLYQIQFQNVLNGFNYKPIVVIQTV